MELTTNSAGVSAVASLPEILEICTLLVSTAFIVSLDIALFFSNPHKNFFIGLAWMVPPNAFTFIGVPSAFPARNIATLLGVYATNRPSLGRFPLSVFALDVHDLSA